MTPEFAISVCRKVSNPWHRNCRALPPNLLLNPDILGAINAFALEKLIKQVNMKLFKSTLRTDLLNSYASLTGLIHSL